MDGTLTESVQQVIRHYWGFDTLRPLQAEAIRAGVEHRDSLVVMPTGGGKSLCYQVPPLLERRTDIVVSPLISLMKDQVDGLQACGYPAEALHSGVDAPQQRRIEASVAAGEYRLVFVSPERLLSPSFMALMEHLDIRAFAIDEAHCISQWGHDFRPEYRKLATLKQRFPRASVHAYTATATGQVRDDIVEQLGLSDPNVLIGVFDRPNLVYRVLPRTDGAAQVLAVLDRHRSEAAIVYCITRKETEATATRLASNGIKAAAYHAGLDADQRRRTQDAFAEERIDVVAATVAFGMGIDRSNVRCVIHAAMPKSIEHYQQETGRAGRDGLEAECVAFYSAADVLKWQWLFERRAENADADEGDMDAHAGVVAAQVDLLRKMQRYCRALRCRHRALSEYFGQEYRQPNCGACDVCLGEVEGLVDATVESRKILSCVARVGQRFGIGHVVDVLAGADTERVRGLGHDQLSTAGILRDVPRKHLTTMVYELIDQGLLERTTGDRPVITLNDASWEVLRGLRQVRLPRRDVKRARRTTFDRESWEGVDRDLFERLREVRRDIARLRQVPAYVIFSDATLRDLARQRPTTIEELADIYGIGKQKQTDLGPRVIEEIARFTGGECRECS
ncbi:MAG: DNA helicase RecQ [Planctomycetes bacterium]|nr:DNA helicase RecQ [Planctomycetota bacterium]